MDETDRKKTGLNELKTIKINIKEELEEIGLELMNLKEKERMTRLKIEEIKELEMKLKELESELNLELKFKELIFEILRLVCKVNLKTKPDNILF